MAVSGFHRYLLEIWTVLYFQYKSLPDEVLEYLSLWEQFSILLDKAYCDNIAVKGRPRTVRKIQADS